MSDKQLGDCAKDLSIERSMSLKVTVAPSAAHCALVVFFIVSTCVRGRQCQSCPRIWKLQFHKKNKRSPFFCYILERNALLECRRSRETEKRTKGGKSEMAERRIWQNGKETLKKIFWTTEKERKNALDNLHLECCFYSLKIGAYINRTSFSFWVDFCNC